MLHKLLLRACACSIDGDDIIDVLPKHDETMTLSPIDKTWVFEYPSRDSM